MRVLTVTLLLTVVYFGATFGMSGEAVAAGACNPSTDVCT